MGFSSKQVAALRRNVEERHIRTRQGSDGRELSYLEGWYVISQANRIFGFDGWSRETLDSKCVLARDNRGFFTAVYTAKVRLTVQANGSTIIREGHGTGEGRGDSPGEVHATALKAAETDATKRALATFGRPFGLELYRGAKRDRKELVKFAVSSAALGQAPRGTDLPIKEAPELSPVAKYARDDTTPIPRPSGYHGRDHYHETRVRDGNLVRAAAGLSASQYLSQDTRKERRGGVAGQEAPKCEPMPAGSTGHPSSSAGPITSGTPSLRSEQWAESARGQIDKSVLPFGEPKRIRDKAHLKFVATQQCLVCGRAPSDAHHLRFAQPRAIGMKVSDEFTVPLCRGHHRQLHQSGNEVTWWEDLEINALEIARGLWEQTHPKLASLINAQIPVKGGTDLPTSDT